MRLRIPLRQATMAPSIVVERELGMSASGSVRLMTTEEMLTLPDDDIERWLIRGQLREKPRALRNRWSARVLARTGWLLMNWLDRQPEPHGEILAHKVGVRIACNPDTTVGIDLVYISAELAAQEPGIAGLVDGLPVLAVEILSPSEIRNEIYEKLELYLGAGIGLVWLIDPHDKSILVYRPNTAPVMLKLHQNLTGEPHRPGFRVPVAEIFSR